MKRKKFKYIVTFCSIALVVGLMSVGVWAAVSTSVSIGTQITFTATGITGKIQAKIEGSFKSNSTHTLGGKTLSGTYADISSWNLGDSTIPNQTLIFEFSDSDDDGQVSDETVTLTFKITNNGDNAFTSNLVGSGTSAKVGWAVSNVTTGGTTTTANINVTSASIAKNATFEQKIVFTPTTSANAGIVVSDTSALTFNFTFAK